MTELFSFNNRKFYRNKHLFVPKIGNGVACNTTSIFLSARLEHDLNWEGARLAAEKAIQENKFLFWEFDFGLADSLLELQDSARFLSFALAIEKFLDQLYTLFKEHSFGVGFYRGDIRFSRRFLWNEEFDANYKEAKVEENLYCASVFAEYMHRLASFLPEGILPFCLIDASSLSCSLASQVLSKNRFCHLHLAVKGTKAPIGDLQWEGGELHPFNYEQEVGVVLPADPLCSSPVMKKLEDVLMQLLNRGEMPRIIPEALLNEHWDELDRMIAFKEGLSVQGRRMLQGFSAAEGEVIII